jgi:hypothetical protein
MRVLAAADVHGEPGPGPRRRYVLLAALLLLALPVAAQDPDTVAGMDAAVRGDWAAACEAFAKVKGDPRSGLRLAAARKQAIARLGPAVDQLVRKRRWRQLAEAAACGLVVDPKYHRFTGAAKRLAKVGFAELPVVTARLRPWATYGLDFGDAELLVEGCLEFLVKTQEAEGHWDSGAHGGGELYDAGVTALALLALAPHHREAADRAAAALRRMQHERGYFGTMTTHSWVYNHAFATEALAEYALLTGTAAAHRDALQRAADFLLAAQNPGSGWRYEPRGKENDTCVTVRAVCALEAARRAGVTVDAGAFEGARAWVQSMTDPNFGGIGYNYPGGAAARPRGKQETFPPEYTQSMTAAGCVVYVLTGADPLRLAKSFTQVHAMPPLMKYPDLYYWDLGSRACVGLHGQIPAGWYGALVKAAAACRAVPGGMRACGVWGEDGGRIYATAMCALALTAPYRVARSRALTAGSFLETRKRSLQVPGWADAIPTGIYVESGMVLDIEARGVIVPFKKGPHLGPAGTRQRLGRSSKGRKKRAPFGCLLGRVDDGQPFVVLPGKSNTLRAYGHLWLLVNDEDLSDNRGWWDVTLELVR